MGPASHYLPNYSAPGNYLGINPQTELMCSFFIQSFYYISYGIIIWILDTIFGQQLSLDQFFLAKAFTFRSTAGLVNVAATFVNIIPWYDIDTKYCYASQNTDFVRFGGSALLRSCSS
jgi:hypothetical protein